MKPLRPSAQSSPVRLCLCIILCLVANAINYIDRANLAVAAPAVEADLGIDAATMGLLLSGFLDLCGHAAVMQMPFGYFADKVES